MAEVDRPSQVPSLDYKVSGRIVYRQGLSTDRSNDLESE